MNLKKRFTTKRLVLMGLFVALSYVISFLEFPIFPVTPYLKLDFCNVFIMLPAFLLGPVEGIIVCGLKEVLSLIDSSSGGVGEIANFLMASAFILLPSIVYQFRKGFKTVALSLAGACLIGTGAALLANRFIVFPLYMGGAAAGVFKSVFWFVLLFNLIKTVAISLVTGLLYKRLSIFLKKKHI